MNADANIREILSNAIRFWERARIAYNAILAVVYLTIFVYYLPQSKAALSLNLLETTFMGAVMVNVFYCGAYLPDICVQLSVFREKWLRLRWGLFIIGLAFASIWIQFVTTGTFSPTK